jgi:hypothetical protein
MVTENITISEHKFVILYIDETTKLVYQVNVHTPEDLVNESIYFYATGIAREEAIKLF